MVNHPNRSRGYAVIVREYYFADPYRAISDWYIRNTESGNYDYGDAPLLFATAEAARPLADKYNAEIARGEYRLSHGEYDRPRAEVVPAPRKAA